MKTLIALFAGLWLSTITLAQLTKPMAIDNGLLKVEFHRGTKNWDLLERESGDWAPVMRNVSAVLSLHDRDSILLSQTDDVSVKTGKVSNTIGEGELMEIQLRADGAGWTLAFTLYEGRHMLSFGASVRNSSGVPWRANVFRPIDAKGLSRMEFSTDTVLQQVNGYQSWSTSEVVLLDSASTVTSYWNTLFYEPRASRSLLFGAITNTHANTMFRSEGYSRSEGTLNFSAITDVKTLLVLPDSAVTMDELLISLDLSPLDNLERYAGYLQEAGPVVNKPFSPTGTKPSASFGTQNVPAGWCSWYYYYERITEDSILQNTNFAARQLKKSGLRYIQIDDGYQIAAGDWNTNKKFPHGHRWLVERIHKNGFLAGLWVAPFAVAESSMVFKQHPEWLLRNANDSLKEFFANNWWGGRIYSLDPTHPEVQKWLENLFFRITNNWGYDYVKIDFLYFADAGGKYHRPVTSAQAYQMGLKAIRKGVSSDKFILGCGAPMGTSIGYVDGMRIGPDVYAAWDGILPGVNAAAQRYPYHNQVWYNDPDCLLVRDPLTLDQARIWTAVVSLSGQMALLSDKLTDLPPERVDLLRSTLPTYGVSARPLDLFRLPEESGLTILSHDRSEMLKLPATWKFVPGDSSEWRQPSYNDDSWGTITVPAQWENANYPNLDGFAWYRVSFQVPAAWQRMPLRLILGKIDDCDQTYLNGNLIGKSGEMPPAYESAWTTFRTYEIPPDVVVWGGRNTLAIRAYDGGGPGGFYSLRQTSLPSVWKLNVEKAFETWDIVGVFNWTKSDQTTRLSPSEIGLSRKKEYCVYEYWSDRYLGEFGKGMSVVCAPTSSSILSIHEKVRHPFILSSSRHLTQGAVDLVDVRWDENQKVLSGSSDHLIGGPYTLVVYVPEGFAVKSAGGSAPSSTASAGDNIVKVRYDRFAGERLSWSIRF